ncbi:MAG: major capsid protein [Microviridae sp.]|nr:MAG: major capsid protein [Microviridae sp.]
MDVKKGEIFNAVKVAQLPRNTFDLTHQHVTTCNFADLIPIMTLEAMPGDIFNLSCETFMRLQPMITPMFHRCDVTVHYFYVPNRLLWDGWEDFITGNNALDGGLNTPVAPYFKMSSLSFGDWDESKTLLNYMGCEIDFATKIDNAGFGTYGISALAPAAYTKIYYDYYIPRELAQKENLQYEFQKLENGLNDTDLERWLRLRKKGWQRDYFTSALPYAQKGDAVLIPMEGDVLLDSTATAAGQIKASVGHANLTGDVTAAAGTMQNVGGVTSNAVYDPNGTLIVNNAQTTINDLRRAMRLQEWLEKNARAGTRYSESLRIHFGVISSDARLQRAEYITGIKSPIIVSEVLATAATAELPQGNMSGHGMAMADGGYDSFYCEEHGFVIGILSVTPKTAYSTGLPRFFTKRADFMDYPWNEFANLGEQEIEQVEIQASFTGGVVPTTTFGYIPRYSEMKFKNDMITGDFADSEAGVLGSLRTWVMQREFGGLFTSGNAALNTNFITGDIQDVAAAPFAIDDTPLMVQQVNKVKVSRKLPVYGTPSF